MFDPRMVEPYKLVEKKHRKRQRKRMQERRKGGTLKKTCLLVSCDVVISESKAAENGVRVSTLKRLPPELER